MVACTCTNPPYTPPSGCPQHGQRSPQTATGTPTGGEARGVPVVDLRQLVNGLRSHADEVRRKRRVFLEAAHDLAGTYGREADFLDSIADTLDPL